MARKRKKTRNLSPLTPLINTDAIEFELMMAELTDRMRGSCEGMLHGLVSSSGDAYFYCDQKGELRLLTQN